MMKLATPIAVITMLALIMPGMTFAAGSAERRLQNEVEFQVSAERETANDLMQTTLVVELENSDSARLAAELNRTMAWALELARADDTVRARSGDYRTWPVYPPNQRRISHWRGSQELVLESTHPDHLNALIGRLQERLQVRGMNFTVSPQQQAELVESLTADALVRFRARAAAIADSLGASAYDIVHIRIVESGGEPPVLLRRTMSVAEDVAVASEPGVSRIGVTAQATIRLRFSD